MEAAPSIPPLLRLFRRESACRVLGPGLRAVLWTQGCTLGCRECLVPESWDRVGGEGVAVRDVARWVLECTDIEGITLTGGEPMQQADALVSLVDRVRQERDLGVVCYTGYRVEALRADAQKELLARVDLLIDGPYRPESHGDLRWRGSSNQRLLFLTGRYRAADDDRGAGLEFSFTSDGRFSFAGVPPWPGFVQGLAVR